MRIVALLLIGLVSNAVFGQDYPITPIPFSEVTITDQFWSKKIKTNHDVTIPIAIQKSVESGRIDNFKKAGGLMPGPFGTEYPFDDSDVFKIIEAASYSLQVYPDRKLEATIDTLIYYISKAQEPDGYVYTNRTIKEGTVHPWAGDKRWVNVNELSHELYNLGHMFEAAAAHYTATGKRTFLDIAIRSADLVCETFGPGKIQNYPGHQEIEIGLVKLYRITKNTKYLDAAKYFLDARGMEGVGRPDKYNQSHLPVTKQTEAVGHSVRASYMWTAMADVAAITGNQDYVKAINALWHDVVDTKYYINGGIGSTGSHEGFGAQYELPNLTAYNETCAGVGNAAWNHRMFLMTGDAKYMDVLERTMFNNILTGVSFEGNTFFYPNPLSSMGQYERSEWFGCACCPPNVARFLPSMPGYIYAHKGDEVFVNLYISNQSVINLPSGMLAIKQKTTLPWEGHASLMIENEKAIAAIIKLRIPGWARNEPSPGGLYEYQDNSSQSTIVKVNGVVQNIAVDNSGYVSLQGSWKKGDIIDLDFPFEVRRIKAREEVLEDIGKVAIERGPLLYCAEEADNGAVQNLIISEDASFTHEFDNELFGGTLVIKTTVRKASRNRDGSVKVSEELPLRLIPYHLWSNRGAGEMTVWIPTSPETTRPAPASTLASNSKITASRGSRALYTIVDQQVPKNSADRSQPVYDWWPKKGSLEWIDFGFEKNQKVSKVKVYWLSDTSEGEIALPDAWEVQYRTTTADPQADDVWKSVKAKNKYNVTKNGWNEINFSEVNALGLRLKVKLKDEYSAGVHEVVIE